MNPLVAAQTYNSRFCPLTSRLPEELLLCILDFLSDDVVALQCLRLVSRTFFRLLSRGSVIWSERRDIPLYIRRNASWLPESEKVQFRRLLQRDGRCDNCKRWNEAHQHSSSDDCKFQQRFRRGSRRVLYCNACDSPHNMCQFSSTNQQPSQNGPGRRCLGQEGSVRLCEHIQITWDTIKTHIEDWRRQQPRGEWKACLRSFNIECHDKSMTRVARIQKYRHGHEHASVPALRFQAEWFSTWNGHPTAGLTRSLLPEMAGYLR